MHASTAEQTFVPAQAAALNSLRVIDQQWKTGLAQEGRASEGSEVRHSFGWNFVQTRDQTFLRSGVAVEVEGKY